MDAWNKVDINKKSMYTWCGQRVDNILMQKPQKNNKQHASTLDPRSNVDTWKKIGLNRTNRSKSFFRFMKNLVDWANKKKRLNYPFFLYINNFYYVCSILQPQQGILSFLIYSKSLFIFLVLFKKFIIFIIIILNKNI